MIVTIITHHCPKCGSTDMVRNGHDYKGAQKYHCKACQAYGTLDAQTGYSQTDQAQVKRAMLERMSLRSVERVFNLSRRTVARWLAQWVETLPDLAQTLLPTRLDDVLELDELWSFVECKANKCQLTPATKPHLFTNAIPHFHTAERETPQTKTEHRMT